MSPTVRTLRRMEQQLSTVGKPKAAIRYPPIAAFQAGTKRQIFTTSARQTMELSNAAPSNQPFTIPVIPLGGGAARLVAAVLQAEQTRRKELT